MAATAVLAKVRSQGRVAALRLARPAGPLVGHGRMAVTPTPGNVVIAVRHAATGGSPDSAAGKSAGLASRLLGWFTGGRRGDTEEAASSADQAQATAAAQAEEQIPDRDLLFEGAPCRAAHMGRRDRSVLMEGVTRNRYGFTGRRVRAHPNGHYAKPRQGQHGAVGTVWTLEASLNGVGRR